MRIISLIGALLVISLLVLGGCAPNSTMGPPTSSSSPLPSDTLQPASASPTVSSPVTSSSPLPSIENSLKIEATTDKNSYLPGEDVTITLSFLNTSKSPVVIAPYVPEVAITRLKYFSWGDERVRTFAAGAETRSLDPGQVITYTLTWNQMDDHGQQAPYGSYDFTGSLRTYPYANITAHVFTILPPQGAMENKIIEVNNTLAAAEGTVTLEEIKIRAAQIHVQAIYTPQGYVMPAKIGNLPTTMKIEALAEYSVDSNTLKNAGPAFDRWVEKGIELVWVINEPVPTDSSELKFRITKIEKLPEQKQWEGPWEFTVQLQ